MSTQSTVTLQDILDICQAFGDVAPVLNVGGSSNQPFITACNDVMNAICGVNFPHKWNEIEIPVFYTNSFQQDYAVVFPGGASLTNLAWLERGMALDINNSAVPKPYRFVEVGRQLPQATGTWYNFGTQGNNEFVCNFFPNKSLYYGVWGDANTGNSTFGNNPVAGSVYTNPLGAQSMPSNPITQIQDVNGNLLLLTTYGTEGTGAPVLPANSAAGTTVSGPGATTQWTVVDPNGQGFRIMPVVSQTGAVWEFNLVGQAKPIRFRNLQQTLDPLPDEFETNFRAGVIAQLYRYSPETKIRAKFQDAWGFWQRELIELRAKQDRELEENGFTVERTVMGSGGPQRRTRASWRGPAYPYNY